MGRRKRCYTCQRSLSARCFSRRWCRGSSACCSVGITGDTLSGPGYPQDAVDIEFGNFLFAGTAQTGLVVEVELTMPAKAQLGDQFFVVAVPDTFAYGFLGIPTEAGSILTVRTARRADLDGDGFVNSADLALVLGFWGTPDGDVDGDGTTTASDLAFTLSQWTGSV